jgi:hypothetical protein
MPKRPSRIKNGIIDISMIAVARAADAYRTDAARISDPRIR